MDRSCPKCGSLRWMTDLPLSATGSLLISATPRAHVSPARGATEVRAETCADCGFTEFYARNPQTVWDAKHPRSG